MEILLNGDFNTGTISQNLGADARVGHGLDLLNG